MTRQSSSPESSSPIASSDRTELFVGTKDGAKLKEGFVAACLDDLGVLSEGVSAESFFWIVEGELDERVLLTERMAPRPTFSTEAFVLLFACLFVLFGNLKENLVAAANADAFASGCGYFGSIEVELLFGADLALRCQWVGL